jgi:membrane protease YdiL (CAAX protease family)
MAGRRQDAVKEKNKILTNRYLPWMSGAALTGCAVFSFPGRDYVLVGLMLFLPLLDRRWRPPALPRGARHVAAWACLLLAIGGLLLWQPRHAVFTMSTLLLAALPEEWFFRAYFMTRLGNGLPANLAASGLFSLLHALTRDWPTALLVFIPSLFYGWLYQRTRDLPLLILVHGLSNLFFAMFLAQAAMKFASELR